MAAATACIVIPAYNEEKTIVQTLASIKALDIPAGTEPPSITLADNNSTDTTIALVQKNYPDVRIIRATKQGTSSARNAGARDATAQHAQPPDIIIFFDGDVVVPHTWLTTTLTYFNDPLNGPSTVAVSGPCTFIGSSWLQSLAAFLWNYLGVLPIHHILYTLLHRGCVMYGGNMAVQKSAFDACGGFDESIQFWGDDTDIGRRIMRHGNIIFTSRIMIEASARGLYDPSRSLIGNITAMIRIASIYGINFIWITIFGKPYSRTIKTIR